MKRLKWKPFVKNLLQSSLEVGNVLNSGPRIPSPFKFLESVYIRHAYKILWNNITEVTRKNVGDMHRILITGASGIGKSNFISYALAKVLTMVDNTLIIVSVPHLYFVIDMNSRQVASVKIIKNSLTLTRYINTLPEAKRFRYFMDEKEHGDYRNWYPLDCVVVLTTSPDEAN